MSLRVFLILCLLATISVIGSTEHTNADPYARKETERDFNAARDITEDVVEDIFKTWGQSSKQRNELEDKLVKEGRVINQNVIKTDLCLIRNSKTDPRIHIMESGQLPFEDASNKLCKRYKLTADEITNDLPAVDLNGELSSQFRNDCMQQLVSANCNAYSKFRRIDGQCNNIQNPRWGSAGTCQPRLLPPNYVGISGFRVSLNGEPLPRPRQLSLNVHYQRNNLPTNYVNHMYMFFGQLLDHDITQTPISTTGDNQPIECCPPQAETHPQCAPILVSRNDIFYSQFNITCINFPRSVICPTCRLGARQFMNQVTSTIDASFVYGNSENETSNLRTNDGTGRLRTTRSNYGDLMPQSQNPGNDFCSFPETNDICFEAGDPRANQHTVLASLHTIFVREHNRIATRLSRINPYWGEERLFQETRRILGAQMQSITYKEYLPITLGNDRMSYFNLWPQRWTEYNPNIDPTTLLEFTTAAFRFGHSLINSLIAYRPLNTTNQPRYLRNEFFQPFDLYRGYAGPLLEGVSNSPAQFFDRHLVQDVRNYLYRIRGNSTGLDLAAINIQRGRDHGIPNYVDTVSYCSEGQIKVRSFNDLISYRLMRPDQVEVLRNSYRFVEDIDLWPGILCEIYNEGSVVGPTAACIIGLQFRNLKFGDRFYFEHINQAGSFTYWQLQELRQATLSQIICLNTEVQRLPRNAMLFSSRNNPYIDCKYVRGIDLSLWKEWKTRELDTV